MGFNADIDIAGGGAGSSLSVNGGKTDLNADYQAVGEQSGIFANEADLVAEGKGTFKGGVFVTSKAAQDNGKSNIVFQQGIEAEDIQNTSSYDGDAISVGLSVGKTIGKPQATMNGLGYGTEGDSDSSITKGGVSGYNDPQGIFTTENREALAGKLENNFDAGQVNEELGAQTQITQEFGKEAPKAVGDYASNRQLDLINEGKVDEADKWAEGGAYRVALHTLVGAIATGSVEGALASGTTAVSVPAVDRYLDEKGIDETTKSALLLGLSAGVGGIVGGDTASTASSMNQTQNNYLNHIERARMARLKKEKSERSNSYGNCVSVRCAEITAEIRALEKLDKARDKEFNIAYDNCRSGAGCKTFYNLHVTQRQAWNASAQKSFKENRGDWILLDDEQNIFHNFDANGKPAKLSNGKYRYKKFLHKNGQLEIIIDTQDGRIDSSDYNRIVTDPTNAGSYNYYSPTDEGIGHKDYDVDPYIDFGSGKGDRTSLINRTSVPTSKKIFGIEIPAGPSGILFGELPPVIGMTGSIANDALQEYVDKASEDFEKEKK